MIRYDADVGAVSGLGWLAICEPKARRIVRLLELLNSARYPCWAVQMASRNSLGTYSRNSGIFFRSEDGHSRPVGNW